MASAGRWTRPENQRVTAVIPHYGDPEPAQRLVASLQAQETDLLERIVVSDDASPVPFPAAPGVHVVRRRENGGFGSAVNSGAELVDTPLVLVLNSDLTIDPTFVQSLVTAAAAWQPAVVAPQLSGGDGTPQWVGRHFPTMGHQLIEWLTPLARFRHTTAMHEAVGHDTRCLDAAVVPVDWVVGAAMLIPVAEFRAVGGFDERYFMNAEEVDLQRRLRERGVPSVFLGTVRAVHEGGASSDPGRRREWLVASRLKYAQKWGGGRRLRFALAAASLANCTVNGVRQLAGRDVDALATLRQELAYLKSRPQ